MADLDTVHTSNRFTRISYPAKEPRVALSKKTEVEKTYPNHRHILLLF